MKCTQCGSMIGPTDQTCAVCGTAVTPTPPTAPTPPTSFGAAAPVPPPAGPPTAPPPAAAPNPWGVPPPGSTWGVPGQPAQPGQPSWQTPAQPYGYADQVRAREVGSGYSIAAIICGVIALLFCPIVLGLVGLGLSAKARSRGESLARVAMIVSLVGLIGGMLLGAFVTAQL